LHGVAELQRAAYRLGALIVDRTPQREERRFHAALVQTREIDVTVGKAPAEIGAADQDALDRVDVAVDADGFRADLARASHFVLSR